MRPNHNRRLSNFQIGLIAVVVITIATYLAFTKDIPFTTPFELKATFQNAPPIQKGQAVRIAGVEELNIGHSIVSRAVLVGMERAVREMKQVMQEHYPNPRRG